MNEDEDTVVAARHKLTVLKQVTLEVQQYHLDGYRVILGYLTHLTLSKPKLVPFRWINFHDSCNYIIWL